jgi:hypothetical protein
MLDLGMNLVGSNRPLTARPKEQPKAVVSRPGSGRGARRAPPRAAQLYSVMPAVRDARSPPRMALIAADETESPFVVIVPQGFHNCTHARKCALQPTPPLPQLVPKASAFFWLHGRTRAAMRALRDDPGPSGRDGVIDAARDLLTEFFAQRWSHKVLVIQYKRSAG